MDYDLRLRPAGPHPPARRGTACRARLRHPRAETAGIVGAHAHAREAVVMNNENAASGGNAVLTGGEIPCRISERNSHEEDQEPMVRHSMDYVMDRGSRVVPLVRNVQSKGEHGARDGMACDGGNYRLLPHWALQTTRQAAASGGQSKAKPARSERPVSLWLWSEI